jgi:UDP-2,4-diacetamido-2,4,6-trideoxy-beta-L-altropyranose hydrolase
MRCLALAQAWQDAGGSADFLMAQSTASIRARLAAENCKVVLLSAAPGSEEDAAVTSEHACRLGAEFLVVDSYAFGVDYQQQVRNREQRLLYIDDACKCDCYLADIVLNQNLTAAEDLYRNCAPGTRLMLGPSFSLLRREFNAIRKWQRQIPPVGRNVLVTLGGSTRPEVGVRVIESLGRARIDELRALFVIGGSSPDTAALESCAAKFPSKILLRRDVSNIAELMMQADIAISAAGSTCWELCFLGLPSILVDVAPNQIPIATELERRGCALYAGNGISVCPGELANTIEKLVLSQEVRGSISVRSRKLVDGHGAERVVSAMREVLPGLFLLGMRGARA